MREEKFVTAIVLRHRTLHGREIRPLQEGTENAREIAQAFFGEDTGMAGIYEGGASRRTTLTL
jgi:hypothetical protein